MDMATTTLFTDLPEEKQRDFILFVGLGKILEDDAGLSAEDLMAPEEGARLTAYADTFLDADDAHITAATALAKTMFREVLERILAGVDGGVAA
jgi:hypothetical protein